MKELDLNEKLSRIQQEFKSKKSKFNSFGKYYFRSAEDILEALKPMNEKYGVYFLIKEKYLGNAIIESKAYICDINGINRLSATAIVGVDLEQKGMQTPQAFGSASSYGKKYALGNLLLIDDTQDADATNDHQTKKTLNINTPEFTKAIEFIKGGGELSKIEEKYNLSKEAKNQLTKIK